MQYVIIRTVNAGVFAGELASRDGQEAELHNARRIWYWDGAASPLRARRPRHQQTRHLQVPRRRPEDHPH